MADANIVSKRIVTQRFESGRMSSELLAMAFGALQVDLPKSASDDQPDPKQKHYHKSHLLQEVER